jgi:hypothetical protein
MRKTLTAAAALAAIVTPAAAVLATTGTAHADAGSPGCVTRAEFRKVDTHGRDAWTRDHVTRVFGTRGHVTSSGSGGTSVEYATCAGDEWSYAEVDFDNHRAWFKWIYVSTY